MDKHNWDRIFNPLSVAIVGAKESPASGGGIFLSNLLDFGYAGQLHPVNPKGGTVKKLPVYKSVRDIPGPVDLVIMAAPAESALKVFEDCAAKGVQAISIFTSGFNETGIEERVTLQNQLSAAASRSGVRILGPNCMGIYCPKSKLTFAPDFPAENGPVGVISQSGGNTMHLVREAALRGVRFSKVISYGNASDLDETDLIDYLIDDTDTEVIVCYIEGVRNGPRFRKVLERATAKKPVLICKGGTSDPGARTVMGHTGFLTSPTEVWSALFKQTGVQQVRSIDELVDTLLPYVFLKCPTGRNALLFGSGGGATIQAADACSQANISLPALPEEIIARLREIFPPQGNIIANPSDLSWGKTHEPISQGLQIIAEWGQIDLVILHLPINLSPRSIRATERLEPSIRGFIEGAKASRKPVAAAVHSAFNGPEYTMALAVMKRFYEAGIPAFKSVESAAHSMDRFMRRNGK